MADDRKRVDLGAVEWLELPWDTANVVRSLELIRERAVADANEAIEWYLESVQPKKRCARAVRTAAIVLVAVAGLIPTLSQITPKADGTPWIPPATAAVALTIAAGLVLYDRFFGFSTGWMRYMSAEQTLRSLVHAFHMDWECCKASWCGDPPSEDRRQAALAMLKAFFVHIDDVVKQETNAWVLEFQSALNQIDESAKAKTATPETGCVNVEVANGEACESGWNVAIDDGACVSCRGRTYGFSNILPGSHRIKIDGAIGGEPKEAQAATQVTAGQVASVQLTLN